MLHAKSERTIIYIWKTTMPEAAGIRRVTAILTTVTTAGKAITEDAVTEATTAGRKPDLTDMAAATEVAGTKTDVIMATATAAAIMSVMAMVTMITVAAMAIATTAAAEITANATEMTARKEVITIAETGAVTIITAAETADAETTEMTTRAGSTRTDRCSLFFLYAFS